MNPDDFHKICNGELDTAHTLSEFPNFPWEKLDEEWLTRIGYIGKGGITAGVDFNPCKPNITFYRKNGSMDRWEVPNALAELVKNSYKQGQDKVKQDIKNILGCK